MAKRCRRKKIAIRRGKAFASMIENPLPFCFFPFFFLFPSLYKYVNEEYTNNVIVIKV